MNVFFFIKMLLFFCLMSLISLFERLTRLTQRRSINLSGQPIHFSLNVSSEYNFVSFDVLFFRSFRYKYKKSHRIKSGLWTVNYVKRLLPEVFFICKTKFDLNRLRQLMFLFLSLFKINRCSAVEFMVYFSRVQYKSHFLN